MAANILVVEDDLLNRDLICKVLRKEGHRVVEACDGAIALEILEVLAFDLVITDFMMPKLNGIKFVEHLRCLQPRISHNLYNRFSLRYFRQDNIGRRGRSSCEAFWA
jgi:CheY-like chemotaxis protein